MEALVDEDSPTSNQVQRVECQFHFVRPPRRYRLVVLAQAVLQGKECVAYVSRSQASNYIPRSWYEVPPPCSFIQGAFVCCYEYANTPCSTPDSHFFVFSFFFHGRAPLIFLRFL